MAKVTKFTTGWYGGATATITTHGDGTATLTVGGRKRTRKTYNTERGARVALGRLYDGTWTETKA